jgi:uncharacterized protein (UPF0216 family)
MLAVAGSNPALRRKSFILEERWREEMPHVALMAGKEFYVEEV